MRPPRQSSKAKTWSEADLILLFQNTPTPIIADAMDGRNVLGCLKPVLPHVAIVGPAVTVKTNPTDWGTVVSAIDVASIGDVLFIDGFWFQFRGMGWSNFSGSATAWACRYNRIRKLSRHYDHRCASVSGVGKRDNPACRKAA